MNDINSVIISGRIVHIYTINRNPARVIVTIHTVGENPKVFAAGKQGDYIIKFLKIGDFVTVEGNIQSSFKDKVGRTVTVFVDKIKKHCSRVPNENKFYIAGDIVSVRTDTKHNISTMIIRAEVNGRRSTIPLTFYNPDHRIYGIVADNPNISISGRIQTVSNNYGSKTLYHQNYVADFPRND